jgi:uncharacterized protein with HEPN domain
MPRSALAYLADICEACEAVDDVLAGISFSAYEATRSIRSAVERELITIGEAVNALGKVAPDLFDGITGGRMIVGLRNVLTHEYAGVDDEAIFAIATSDLQVLRGECVALLEQVKGADEPAD